MATRFTIEEHVRWSDTDRAGIIYYGQFLRFFEIAETELFREVGLPYSEVFDRFDIWLPRVQIHFDFRKPLLLDDAIEVSACVARFGTRSLTLRFEVMRKGDSGLVAEGHVVLACVSRSTFKSVPVPDEIKERLKLYLAGEDFPASRANE
ncbi:MAG TPA: thioesterase family protein [Blastocatellia bacterium]|nr:thioesterase family protein [Blastocatellia bacterium]